METRRSLRSSAKTYSSRESNATTGRNQSAHHLRWNMRGQHVLRELGRLYHKGGMREGEGDMMEGLTTDVTLFSSEGDGVPAHRLVLMLCSPYFKKIFNQVRNPREPAIVVLSHVKTPQLQQLVRFLYTGEVHLSSGKEAEDLKKVARFFGVVGMLHSYSKTVEPSPPSPPRVEEESPQISPPASVEETPVKYEPPDPDPLGENDDIVDDFEGGAISGADDDTGSNFSDTLEPAERPPPKPRKRRRPEDEEPVPRVHPRTGKLCHWTRISLPEEEVRRDWRIRSNSDQASGRVTTYYCALGRQCPATLKKRELKDGTTVYFRNPYDHSNHRGPDDTFGLSDPQKELVMECIRAGIHGPNNILLKFDVTPEVKKPPKSQVINFLRNRRLNNPELRKRKGESKWPKRVRKKKMPDGPPRKRGRPPQSSGVPHNVEDPSQSSEPAMPTESEGIYHPNHFPLYGSIPAAPPPPPAPPTGYPYS